MLPEEAPGGERGDKDFKGGEPTSSSGVKGEGEEEDREIDKVLITIAYNLSFILLSSDPETYFSPCFPTPLFEWHSPTRPRKKSQALGLY